MIEKEASAFSPHCNPDSLGQNCPFGTVENLGALLFAALPFYFFLPNREKPFFS